MKRDLEQSCGPRIIKTYMDKMTASDFEELGVTYSQGSVLCTLSDHDGLSMKDISEALMIDKAMVTRLVTKLMDSGFVVNKAEGHAYCLSLTDKGKAAAGRSKEIICKAWESVLSDLTAEERETFNNVLTKIAEKMRMAIQ